ncbi:MAG: acyltransferase [Sphingomonas bacterium]|nr:acyltransferase [Sphingomonas bacterium]
MQSSSGKYFPGLDHVRAVAAFLVVSWHFAHGSSGFPVPFNQAPALGLIDEGHVGVALFMTLSGFLFAKLIDGRPIHYAAFLWNRALRLMPLIMLVLLVVGLLHFRGAEAQYLTRIGKGLFLPVLPNGIWSITAEMHFYVVLPLLLWVSARWRWAPLALVAAALCVRLAIHASGMSVQDAAYWTIIGRIDQFALGIFFYHRKVTGRFAAAVGVAIVAFYAAFDAAGGFYGAPDELWLFIPTIEGVTLGALIAWYDANPIRSPKMWLVQKAGEYSFSIYLLHFFVVFEIAPFIDQHIMRLNSLYAALPWSLVFFIAMIGVGHLSYTFIEKPPLRFRKPYIKAPEPARVGAFAG